MLSYKQLFTQNHNINDKKVFGDNVQYYKTRTDTAASCEIDGIQYHFFDGTTTFQEWVNDFRTARIGLHGAAIGYDEVAEEFFEEMASNIDLNKKQVFVGYSRGGPLAILVLIRAMRLAALYGKTLNCEMISFNMPKPGSYRLNRYLKKLGFKHTYIYMKGDVVHNFVWWWQKPYATKTIALQNDEKGIVAKHQNIGPYL